MKDDVREREREREREKGGEKRIGGGRGGRVVE